MYQITFQFENGGKPVIVDAAPNTSLLDVAKAAHVAIDAPGQDFRGHGRLYAHAPYFRGGLCRGLAAQLREQTHV